MLVVRAEGLSKSYWLQADSEQNTQRFKTWALRDVSFELEQGDRMAIFGRNGSGKSTLLKILSRIISASEGRFYLCGKLTALLEVGVGFHPDLTGRENIFLKGTLLGMQRREVQQELETIVEFAELGPYIDMPVKSYSTGMHLRLGFAVAASVRSEILVIDETLAVGDAQFQNKCLQRMNQLRNEQGRTVILVSHSIDLLQGFCNKAILLEQGALLCSGSAQEVAAKYRKLSGENEAVPPGERKDRYGNRSVTVESVQFNGQDAGATEELFADEPLRIVFRLSHQPHILTKDIVVGCAFGLSYGQHLVAWFSEEDATVLESSCVCLDVPALELRPGRYYFSYRVGIGGLDPDCVGDGLESGFVFTVSSRNGRRNPYPSCVGRGGYLSQCEPTPRDSEILSPFRERADVLE